MQIERTLSMMPTLCSVVLLAVFLVLELRTRGSVSASDGGFMPSGNGYEYFVDAQTVVYLEQHGSSWRVYLVSGGAPFVPMKRDRRGCYFTLNCRSSAEAEAQIDRIFHPMKGGAE